MPATYTTPAGYTNPNVNYNAINAYNQQALQNAQNQALNYTNTPWYNANYQAVNPGSTYHPSSNLYTPTPLPTPNYSNNPFGSNTTAPKPNQNFASNTQMYNVYNPTNKQSNSPSISNNPYNPYNNYKKTTSTTNTTVWNLPNQTGDSLMNPTVATAQNPVILKKPQNQDIAPKDYSFIDTLDKAWVYDIIDSINAKSFSNKQPTEDDFMAYQRAQRRLQELNAPQDTTAGIDQLIAEQNKFKEDFIAQQKAQEEKLFKEEADKLQAQIDAKNNDAIQQGNREKEAALRVLWWSAEGSYSAGQQVDIQRHTNDVINYNNQVKEAELEKYKAEVQGADQKQIQAIDDNIAQLTLKSADAKVEQIKAINDYNKEAWVATQKKIDDFLAVVQAGQTYNLTDQQKELAKAYWAWLVSKDWDINLDQLKNIPQMYQQEAMQQALIAKWAIPKEAKTLNTSNGAFVSTDWGNTRKKIDWTDDKGTWKEDKNWNLYNDKTWATTAITWEWTIQTAIAKAIQVCWNAAQCWRFINEVGKQAGINLNISDSYQSKLDAVNNIGQANSIEEIGQGSIFTYPVKGSPYGHIGIVTAVNADWTINIMDYNAHKDQKRNEINNYDPAKILNAGGAISKPLITNDNVSLNKTEDEIKAEKSSTKELTSLRKEFDALQEVKDFKKVTNYLNTIDVNAQKKTPAGDMSLIYSYMKLLDPNSTVREWEYATAKNAGTLDDKTRNLYNKAIKGTLLTDSQRQDFLNSATQIHSTYADIYNKKLWEYKTYITEWWNPDSIGSEYIPKNKATNQNNIQTNDIDSLIDNFNW